MVKYLWNHDTTLTVLLKTLPSVFSKDLLKYVNSKQDLVNEIICSVFIDQIVEEVCRQANIKKLTEYKVKKIESNLNSEETIQKIDGSICIIVNLKTSPELGEAYPGYIGELDEERNIFTTFGSYTLNQTDAIIFEVENTYVYRQKCMHKQVLDLIITSN